MPWTMLAAIAAMMSPQPNLTNPCAGDTTPEADACAEQFLAKANAELKRYTIVARRQVENLVRSENADKPPDAFKAPTLADFDKAVEAWQAYRDAECHAVLDKWSDGTIATVKSADCKTRLTRLRTHMIWQNWLHIDGGGGPDILPEPLMTGPIG